jgi:hypothetical protein
MDMSAQADMGRHDRQGRQPITLISIGGIFNRRDLAPS